MSSCVLEINRAIELAVEAKREKRLGNERAAASRLFQASHALLRVATDMNEAMASEKEREHG